MPNVTIEIDSKWVKVAHSPMYWLVGALQGVSISFAPLFLYWSGKGSFYHGYESTIVPLCFAAIFFVGFFYMSLGGAVLRELRKKQSPSIPIPNPGITSAVWLSLAIGIGAVIAALFLRILR